MPGGRPKAKYSQALRLLQIWEMLHHRARVTIPELMAEFRVDRRTVQRDIAALGERYAIEEGERTDGGEKTIHLRPTARVEALKLTLAEMLALYMGKNLFAFTRGTQLESAMSSLYDKLQTRLCERNVRVRERLPKKLYCTTGFPKTYGGSDDVLNDVLSGIVDETKIAITYRIPGKRPYQDTIHPYTLVAHNSALYVIAHSEHAKGRRLFALERILESARQRGATFEFPSDYDPSAELERAFGITTGGVAERVRLQFSPEVAPYIAARRWHTSQRTKARRDGGIELTMNVAIGEELIHWITGYGNAVRVLSPVSLRRAVQTRHKGAA